MFGNYLIVFGGLNDSGKIRNDLYLLDMSRNFVFPSLLATASMTWNKPEVSGARPGPRLSCASAVYILLYFYVISKVYGNKFWIFGGYDGKTRMNDVHCLELCEQNLYNKLICLHLSYHEMVKTSYIWTTSLSTVSFLSFIKITAYTRYSHSMTKDRNFLLIFGGDDGCVNQLDDLHILDLG